jgi:hypothetical protein
MKHPRTTATDPLTEALVLLSSIDYSTEYLAHAAEKFPMVVLVWNRIAR